ncbi:MAG: hypothetical protein ACPGXY_06755, partial [Alphaproteobacteria bacterium]
VTGQASFPIVLPIAPSVFMKTDPSSKILKALFIFFQEAKAFDGPEELIQQVNNNQRRHNLEYSDVFFLTTATVATVTLVDQAINLHPSLSGCCYFIDHSPWPAAVSLMFAAFEAYQMYQENNYDE